MLIQIDKSHARQRGKKNRKQRLNTKHIKSVVTYKSDNNITATLAHYFNADIYYDTEYTTATIDSSNNKPLYESLPIQDCIITTLAIGYGKQYSRTQIVYQHNLIFGNTTNFPTTTHINTCKSLINEHTKDCLAVEFA